MIGTVKLPDGARVIDAKGKYLLPGLWDMHVHIGDYENADTVFQDSLYRAIDARDIANGLTAIREMAQRWPHGADAFRRWQREVAAGRWIGPRTIGPSADVTQGSGIALQTPEDAIRVADSLNAAGDAFIKFHGKPNDRAIFFALLREARRLGLPVVGHVPESVTDVEAADSGMRSIEHASSQFQCLPPSSPGLDSAALEQACAPVAQAYLRNDTWLVPTMVADWLGPVTITLVPYGTDPGYHDPSVWADGTRLWRTLHRLGVRHFLAGSDWGLYPEHFGPAFQAGYSAREELVFLVDGGLTPLEALQAGTLNPALFLHATDSLGTVAPGKLADLVLLDANPLADIRNVLHLWGVVANGRYFDRNALAAMDPDWTQPNRGYTATPPPLSP